VSRKWYPLLFHCALITEWHSKSKNEEIYVSICLDHYIVGQGDTPEEAKEALAETLWIQDNALNEQSNLKYIKPFPYDITKARYYGRFIEYFTIDLNEVDLDIKLSDEA